MCKHRRTVLYQLDLCKHCRTVLYQLNLQTLSYCIIGGTEATEFVNEKVEKKLFSGQAPSAQWAPRGIV